MSNRVTLQRGNMSKNTDFIAATALLNEYEAVRELAALQLHQASALLLQITAMKAAAVCWVSSYGVRLITTCGLGDNLLARSLPKDLSFFAPERVITSQDNNILQTIEAYLGINGYQSVISVPLVAYSKQVMGAILLLDQKPLELEAERLAHLSDLAGLVMQGINATREAKLSPINSLSLLEQAVLQSQESVITFDLNGTIQTWNVGATQIYGYSSQTIVGQDFKCLLPAEEIVAFQAALRRLQYEQMVVPYETTRIHQSGFRVQVRSSLHIIKNEAGIPAGFIEYTGILIHPNQAKKDSLTTQSRLPQQSFAEIVLQTIEQGVTVTNSAGHFEYVNQQYADMLGYSVDELLGLTPFDLLPKEQEKRILEEVFQERTEGWFSTYQHQAARKDGNLITFEVTGYPRFDEHQQVKGSVAVVRDVTLNLETPNEVTKIQAKLERERKFALQVTSSINQGLLVLDASGLVVYANPAVIQIAGLTNDHSILGKKPWQLVPPYEQAAIRAEWQQLLKGQKRIYRHGILRPDQAECFVEVTIYPKLNQQKRFISAVMLITDITETLALETATQQARRALARESRKALVVANAISDGLAFINKNYIIEYANPAWVELFGFDSSKSVIGKSSKTWVHEDDVALLEQYEHILESGQSCQYSFRVRHSEGGFFRLENFCFPHLENGVYLGFTAVVCGQVSTKT
ncbi:MAG: hypothetical protein RLZZ156_265 [Deinococcota bacterium]|jgi:PAS domain S-box-containing protein